MQASFIVIVKIDELIGCSPERFQRNCTEELADSAMVFAKLFTDSAPIVTVHPITLSREATAIYMPKQG